jgi:hypothetical protein
MNSEWRLDARHGLFKALLAVFVFNYVPQHNKLCMKVHLSTKLGHIKFSRTFILFL